MGLWSRLFGLGRQVSTSATEEVIRIQGNGEYEFDIVGESHYQKALDELAGGKSEDGHHIETEALLMLDDDNEYDDKAVAVGISGHLVGHLPREMARSFRQRLAEGGHPRASAVCGALIVGGWRRSNGDEGHYGVRLDLPPG